MSLEKHFLSLLKAFVEDGNRDLVTTNLMSSVFRASGLNTSSVINRIHVPLYVKRLETRKDGRYRSRSFAIID
jgi:hypothetical protein